MESNSSRIVYRLATMLLMAVGLCIFIFASNPNWIGWIKVKIDFLPDILKQTGLAMFVSSLIVLLLRGVQTEAIKLVFKKELESSHDNKCKKEHDGLDEQHKTITGEIAKILDLTNSGLDKIYPSRHDPDAVSDVINRLVKLMKLNEASNQKTLKLMGCTLRVFFLNGQDFRKGENYYIKKILENNPQCNIELLALNPYCPEAIYRSHVESFKSGQKTGYKALKEYEGSTLYLESRQVMGEYEILQGKYPNVTLKYYHEGNSMLLFCFDSVAFVQQYTFAPPELGHSMPFMKFTAAKGNAYELMKDHFDQLWITADTFKNIQDMDDVQKTKFFTKYQELVSKQNNHSNT